MLTENSQKKKKFQLKLQFYAYSKLIHNINIPTLSKKVSQFKMSPDKYYPYFLDARTEPD
jgi:hypothetical protein